VDFWILGLRISNQKSKIRNSLIIKEYKHGNTATLEIHRQSGRFAGPTGLSMYNGNKIRVFDKQSGIKCQGLRTIEILDDIVWLGTDLGLESINTDGSPTNFILEKEWTYGLAQKIIGCENTIWVGTSTGLLKIDINGNRLIVSMNAELGFVKNIILLDNNTVIATSAEGLIKCDGETIIHLDKDNFSRILAFFALKSF